MCQKRETQSKIKYQKCETKFKRMCQKCETQPKIKYQKRET